MIADSSAWIAYLRNTDTAATHRLHRALSRQEPLWMPAVVYSEVLQGARDPQHFVALQSQLDQVPPLVLPDPHGTARAAALLYARCRWQGITPRSAADCLIAACAVEADQPLLHSDRDFVAIASAEPKLRFA